MSGLERKLYHMTCPGDKFGSKPHPYQTGLAPFTDEKGKTHTYKMCDACLQSNWDKVRRLEENWLQKTYRAIFGDKYE